MMFFELTVLNEVFLLSEEAVNRTT